jgi:hypothetical protein
MTGIREACFRILPAETQLIQPCPDRDFSIYFNIQHSAFSIVN